MNKTVELIKLSELLTQILRSALPSELKQNLIRYVHGYITYVYNPEKYAKHKNDLRMAYDLCALHNLKWAVELKKIDEYEL